MTEQKPSDITAPVVKVFRTTRSELARANSMVASGAVIVSVLIVLGYFAVVFVMLNKSAVDVPDNMRDMLLIMFGGLASAFGAVQTYWLGSSAGSARKDQIAAAATLPPSAPPANQGAKP